MNSRWTLAVATLLAVAAGLWMHGSMRAREERARKEWELVEVLVAAEDVEEGEPIRARQVVAAEMPARFVSDSMVHPAHADTIVGQRVLVPLRRGDPILWSHFRAAQEEGRLSERILRRTRAVTVPVTERSSVGGFIQPNDHVDVLATFRDPQSQEMVTVTLLHNVVVLATGRAADREDGWSRGYSEVSLLVLPEEAELLVLAQELGNITLVLRHPDEVDVDSDRGRTTVQTLLTGERSRALEQLRRATVQVIRGSRTADLLE